MFDEIKGHFDSLLAMNQEKLAAGHYPTCRDARYALQQIKLEAQAAREKVIGFYHDAMNAKKKVKSAKTTK